MPHKHNYMEQIFAVRRSDVIPRRSIKFYPAHDHVSSLYKELINGKDKTWITGRYPRQNTMSCWSTNVLTKYEVSSSMKIVWRRKINGGSWDKAKNGSAYNFYDQKHNYQVKILLKFFSKFHSKTALPVSITKFLLPHQESAEDSVFWGSLHLKERRKEVTTKHKGSLFTNPYGVILQTLEFLSALLCKTSSLCRTLKTFHFLLVSLPLHNSLPVSKAPFPEGWSGPAWEPSEWLNILSVSMHKNAINVLSLSLSVSPSSDFKQLRCLVSRTNFCPTEGIQKNRAVRQLHPPNNKEFHAPNHTYQFSAVKGVIILN